VWSSESHATLTWTMVQSYHRDIRVANIAAVSSPPYDIIIDLLKL